MSERAAEFFFTTTNTNSAAMATHVRIKLQQKLMQKRPKLNMQLVEAAKKTKWNIYKGDTVQVVARRHSEFGKQGRVLAVERSADTVVVAGVNVGPVTVPADEAKNAPERTLDLPRALHYSNVNLVDPVTGRPTRIHRQVLDDGTKVRVAKRSGAIIPRPEREPYEKNVREPTGSCTTESDGVWDVTYDGNAEMPPWERYEHMMTEVGGRAEDNLTR